MYIFRLANSPFVFAKKDNDGDPLANVADKQLTVRELLLTFIECITKNVQHA